MFERSPRSPAEQRYTRSVLVLMTGYALILFGVSAYFTNDAPRGLLAYAAAALPAVPIVGVFVVLGRLVTELRDEYVRMLLVRQMLVATGFMLALATVYGFIESFGLAPHLPAYYAAVVWFAGLGVGGLVNFVLQRGEPGE